MSIQKLECKVGVFGAIRFKRVVCKRCGSTLPETPRYAEAYSCGTCDSWTKNVRFESVNPLNYCGA